jgi:hypothetical protein
VELSRTNGGDTGGLTVKVLRLRRGVVPEKRNLFRADASCTIYIVRMPL